MARPSGMRIARPLRAGSSSRRPRRTPATRLPHVGKAVPGATRDRRLRALASSASRSEQESQVVRHPAAPRSLLALITTAVLMLLAALRGDWGTAAGQTAGPPPPPRGAAESAAPGGPAVVPPPASDYRLPAPEA